MSSSILGKKRKAPKTDDRIKRQRLDWAEDRRGLTEWWKSVIFTDEKKFNLDGPDGLNSYWHDKRKEKLRFEKRQQGGASIMFWGAMGARGLGPLVKVEGNINSAKYQDLLRDHFLPNAARIGGRYFILQHDGASVHRSASTMAWLRAENINTLDWPSHSPDMNIIENLWGMMAREVYRGGRVFSNKHQLERACRDAWASISHQYILSLYDSMPKRINELIEAHGGHTSY
jgi:hypothetical protein